MNDDDKIIIQFKYKYFKEILASDYLFNKCFIMDRGYCPSNHLTRKHYFSSLVEGSQKDGFRNRSNGRCYYNYHIGNERTYKGYTVIEYIGNDTFKFVKQL